MSYTTGSQESTLVNLRQEFWTVRNGYDITVNSLDAPIYMAAGGYIKHEIENDSYALPQSFRRNDWRPPV